MNDVHRPVQWVTVSADSVGQRIDNWLLRTLKGVPKSHIYKMIRRGEIRVNKKRISAEYKLQLGEEIRLPPIFSVANSPKTHSPDTPLSSSPSLASPMVLFEDEHLLAINKPSGVAVHGGSGISLGLVEQFRILRPECHYLELVHRLDRDTSGIVLLAKNRITLLGLQEQFKQHTVQKRYLAATWGRLPGNCNDIKDPLKVIIHPDGHKQVIVHTQGQYAHSIVHTIAHNNQVGLVQVEIKTGRTHQIRVHLQHHGTPILLDERYGIFDVNKKLRQQKILSRMFLHAWRLRFEHPILHQPLQMVAPLDEKLAVFIQSLKRIDFNIVHQDIWHSLESTL